MKTLRFPVAVALLASPALLVAQRANLRLGTILPANSVWDRALKRPTGACASRCAAPPETKRPSSGACA